MKVSVLTVDDVVIKNWRWWSDWVDIAIFDYESRPWLVQMSVSRTNAKKFKAISVTGRIYKQTTAQVIGDLVQMEPR